MPDLPSGNEKPSSLSQRRALSSQTTNEIGQRLLSTANSYSSAKADSRMIFTVEASASIVSVLTSQ